MAITTPRVFENFLHGYMSYTAHLESPEEFHLWTGISTIAGALRGKCWIDMGFFKWKPNCFIIMVAPPGIAAKSTTLDQGMSLLREIEGINFAPASATWQGLCGQFMEVQETFNINSEDHTMSNITVAASELGTFLDMSNREMIDMLVDMWDGKDTPWIRRTKGGGSETIQAPWVNLGACTTPNWIAENMPRYAIGGGFTSRCIFLYADKKSKAVAYPHLSMPKHQKELRRKLVHDLKEISKIKGAFTITEEAIEFGTTWYNQHTMKTPKHLKTTNMQGYAARKQSHIHKIAMCLSAAESGDMVINMNHMEAAISLLGMCENNMAKVFDSVVDDNDAKNLSILKQRIMEMPSRGEKRLDRNLLFCEMSSRMSLTAYELACSALIRAGFVRDIADANRRYMEPITKTLEAGKLKLTAEDYANVRKVKGG